MKSSKEKSHEMKFQKITEKEYRDFWENHPLKSFLSAPEISQLRKKQNWESSYVGVREDGSLVAATMLLSHKRHFQKWEFYSPRGLLLDFKNKDLLTFFIMELGKYIKENHGYIFRVDPYLIYKQRDIDGVLVEKGENHTKAVQTLLELGFKKVPTDQEEQASWMFSLNLEGKSSDEIFKEFQSSTRNHIKKTEKFGIRVREISYDELDDFYKIMVETGKRKGFAVRSLSYFQEMYQLFHDRNEVKFFITDINLKDYQKTLEEEKEEKISKLEKMKDKKEGARKSLEEEISSLDKRLEETLEIIHNTGSDIITLSGSMFMLIKPEVVFLAGGNYEEYMKFNSQYLIQWELIKYGIENGFLKHNFYGIPAGLDKNSKDYGIYEFKKRFNGYVEELIGEYELPITWHYHLIKFIHKIRRR